MNALSHPNNMTGKYSKFHSLENMETIFSHWFVNNNHNQFRIF